MGRTWKPRSTGTPSTLSTGTPWRRSLLLAVTICLIVAGPLDAGQSKQNRRDKSDRETPDRQHVNEPLRQSREQVNEQLRIDRQHANEPFRARPEAQPSRSIARGVREPAFAAGLDSGYEKGIEDGRDAERYDPVRHRDYRDAERGYRDGYGSRDAYRTNFRSGFRQGYEDGYRAGTRNRR